MARRKPSKPQSDGNSKETSATRTNKTRTKRRRGASQQSYQQRQSTETTSRSNELADEAPTADSSTYTVAAVEGSRPYIERLVDIEDTTSTLTMETHTRSFMATTSPAARNTRASTAAQSGLQATDGTRAAFPDYEMIDALEWMENPSSSLLNLLAGLERPADYTEPCQNALTDITKTPRALWSRHDGSLRSAAASGLRLNDRHPDGLCDEADCLSELEWDARTFGSASVDGNEQESEQAAVLRLGKRVGVLNGQGKVWPHILPDYDGPINIFVIRRAVMTKVRNAAAKIRSFNIPRSALSQRAMHLGDRTQMELNSCLLHVYRVYDDKLPAYVAKEVKDYVLLEERVKSALSRNWMDQQYLRSPEKAHTDLHCTLQAHRSQSEQAIWTTDSPPSDNQSLTGAMVAIAKHKRYNLMTKKGMPTEHVTTNHDGQVDKAMLQAVVLAEVRKHVTILETVAQRMIADTPRSWRELTRARKVLMACLNDLVQAYPGPLPQDFDNEFYEYLGLRWRLAEERKATKMRRREARRARREKSLLC